MKHVNRAINANYRLIDFKTLGDGRGSLVAIEGRDTPFEIKRIYYIYNTQPGVIRGKHAHKLLKQIAIAVKGSCTFVMDSGGVKEEIKLDNPSAGLYFEGLIWHEMKDFSDDCVLVILASDYYDESDYIRDYDLFIKEVSSI